MTEHYIHDFNIESKKDNGLIETNIRLQVFTPARLGHKRPEPPSAKDLEKMVAALLGAEEGRVRYQ